MKGHGDGVGGQEGTWGWGWGHGDKVGDPDEDSRDHGDRVGDMDGDRRGHGDGVGDMDGEGDMGTRRDTGL